MPSRSAGEATGRISISDFLDEALKLDGPVISAFTRLALSLTGSVGAFATDAEMLAALVPDRAFEVVGRDADHALELDPEHPGYLRRSLGRGTVHVPFNLAPVFPGSDVLDPIHDVASAAVLSPTSTVCLGGSATFTGSLRAVGDLDLCEYYSADPSAIATAVCSLVEAADAVVEVKCAGERWSPPWTDLQAELPRKLMEVPTHPPANRMKLDLIADAGSLGVLPMTNVVLPVGDDPNGGHARASFVYQEAVLALGEPPRRGLLDPDAFGAYLRWLREQVDSYGSDDALAASPLGALKALKRTVSFFLAIGLEDMVEDAIATLNLPEVEALLLALRHEETQTLSEKLLDPARSRWLDRIAAEAPPAATAEERAAAATAAAEIVRSFVEDIRRLSQDYGMTQ